MKKFKSILALTASVLALSAFAAPVSAFATSIDTDEGTGTSTVKDTVEAGFMVTIPADVTFSGTVENRTLKAEGTTQNTPIVLDKNKVLKVSVASQNGLKLMQTGVATELATYSFTAAAGNSEITTVASNFLSSMGTAGNSVLLATFTNNTTDTVTLAFTEDTKNDVPAGEYSDILTFTIDVNDAS